MCAMCDHGDVDRAKYVMGLYDRGQYLEAGEAIMASPDGHALALALSRMLDNEIDYHRSTNGECTIPRVRG